MGDATKDMVSGTVAGVSQLVIGHPLDTIKVKLQSSQHNISASSSGAMNAVVFTLRDQLESLSRSNNIGEQPLTVMQHVSCGAGAGVAVATLACPTELIKCRLQAHGTFVSCGATHKAVRYGGPIDVARHAFQSAGVRRLFREPALTMTREIVGLSAMFGVYEVLKQQLVRGKDSSSMGGGSLMLAGGLAGASFCLSSYPIDLVKSVVQVDDYISPKYSGSFDVWKKILASEGVKGLYKGLGPAMLRSLLEVLFAS
ncbi:transporter [Lithospermum erythrorhizon]|uniref:Transporter n=1 Tax=Lithospermum erythrorhizon TaxID=34254 RepID=A0AAV3NIS3_LITER